MLNSFFDFSLLEIWSTSTHSTLFKGLVRATFNTSSMFLTGIISTVIQNMGTETLEPFTVEVIEDGEVLATETFNGTLDLYATTTINFGSITVNSSTIEVVIVSDDNSNDNSLSQEIGFSTAKSSQKVKVNLLTDNFANETNMEILDENNNVVWSEGNEAIAGTIGTGQLAPNDATNPLANNTLYEWDVNLPTTGCFKFRITDYFGDGLAASTNTEGGIDGSWNIEDNNGIIIAQQSVQNFENEDEVYFENTQAGTSSINENTAMTLAIYPNPIRSNANVDITLTEKAMVRMDIVNILGETLISEVHPMKAGYNSISLNVNDLSSGVYFAHLTLNGETITTKITVAK